MPSSDSSPSVNSPASPPRVSVVIPLFNCLALTQAMIASLRTTWPRQLSFEIILVDDGSTDGTREWLATLGAPFRVILNERNLGYATANNRGAAAARGEFLLLLNNDLVLTPHWLEPMLALHHRLGDRTGLIGNIQRNVRDRSTDHTGIFINFKGKPEHDRHLPWWWWWPNAWRRAVALTGACVLVRRELWNQLGGFSEDYVNGCEDIDLCLRAAACGQINAVSLRSAVWHHVSASPGRKVRDEENTCRLVLRWRETLVQLGAKAWCRHYLATHWTTSRDPQEHALARQIFLHVYGIRRTPPGFVLTALDAGIGREMSRWREMLGSRFAALEKSS